MKMSPDINNADSRDLLRCVAPRTCFRKVDFDRNCDAHAHFFAKPFDFRNSCDVLLVLDSGSEVPVHSGFLAAHSSVLCGILTLDREAALRRLPFPGCSDEAARAFLEYLYAEDRSTVLTVEKAELVSLLAHKYGLHDTLQCCDEFLASRVNIDGSSWELWVRTFLCFVITILPVATHSGPVTG